MDKRLEEIEGLLKITEGEESIYREHVSHLLSLIKAKDEALQKIAGGTEDSAPPWRSLSAGRIIEIAKEALSGGEEK